MTILTKKVKQTIKIQPRIWSQNNGIITLIGNNSQLIEVKIENKFKSLNEWLSENHIKPYVPIIIKKYIPIFKSENVSCAISTNTIKNCTDEYYNKYLNYNVDMYDYFNAAVVQILDNKFIINNVQYSKNDAIIELNNFEKYHLIVVKGNKIFELLKKLVKYIFILDIDLIYYRLSSEYSSINLYWNNNKNTILNICNTEKITFDDFKYIKETKSYDKFNIITIDDIDKNYEIKKYNSNEINNIKNDIDKNYEINNIKNKKNI